MGSGDDTRKEAAFSRLSTIESLMGKEHKNCVYTYDFGDNWEHGAIVEKILPPKKGQVYPVCVDGARHRLPEDAGGVSGYERFLSIVNNPKYPEHEDYLLWAEKDTGGRKFDPDYFYLNEVNRTLAKLAVRSGKTK